MRKVKIGILLFSVFLFQGCGIANYAKSKQVLNDIAAEKEKTPGLDKRLLTEQRRLKKLQDSIRIYNDWLGGKKNGK